MDKSLKIFFIVLTASAICGGFVGGELMDKNFSIIGAVIGFIATAIVLISIGAYFYAQDRKKLKNIPENVIDVFDRMINKYGNIKISDEMTIENQIKKLINDDIEKINNGEKIERRLMPHHAIKREIILLAYKKDFDSLDVKTRSINEEHYKGQISSIKQLHYCDLDKIIIAMESERNDVIELESNVRINSKIYSSISPVFESCIVDFAIDLSCVMADLFLNFVYDNGYIHKNSDKDKEQDDAMLTSIILVLAALFDRDTPACRHIANETLMFFMNITRKDMEVRGESSADIERVIDAKSNIINTLVGGILNAKGESYPCPFTSSVMCTNHTFGGAKNLADLENRFSGICTKLYETARIEIDKTLNGF